MKAKDAIAKARSCLIIDHPFIASLLLPMPFEEDKSIPTMATDGDKVIYNPDFVEGLTFDELTFALAHETFHCVFDHMGRRESRSPNRWNQAADYIINDILVNEKIGTIRPEWLLNPRLVASGKGTAEGVYTLLPQSDEKKGAGQKGGAMDQVLDAGSEMGTQAVDQATATQKSAEMKVRVIQAKNAAKMAGKLSAGIDRLITEMLKPKVDWREVLRNFVTEKCKDYFSFARPKRRFLADEIYLPGLMGEKMGMIDFLVDCSGSVTPALLNKFATEINAIREDLKPSRIRVIYFDAVVTRVETFDADDGEVKLKPSGGGGTAFSPCFEFINSSPEELPIAVVCLTDLECDDFGPPPAYPVLWCVLEGTSRNTVPFGEIVEVSEHD